MRVASNWNGLLTVWTPETACVLGVSHVSGGDKRQADMWWHPTTSRLSKQKWVLVVWSWLISSLFLCGVPNFSSHPQAGGCCEYTQERFQRQSEEPGGGRSRPVCPQEPCFFSGSCFGQCSFPWLSPVLHTVVLLRRAVVCRKVSLSVVTCRHQHYLSIKSVNVSQFHHISYRGFNAYPKSH